ncbi:unnamed protein product [Urochloa humidicola]
MAENRNRGNNTWWVAGASLGLLTLNSGLAIYRANGDPASILFVAGSYLVLLLLFLCLRDYERALPVSPERERTRRAVWPLTTVLTPPRAGGGRRPSPTERHVAAALVSAAFGAMTCDAALAIHDALGDMGSATFVLIAYAAFLVLTFRFLHAFACRVRGVGHG